MPVIFHLFITNTFWHDAYSMHIRPLALLQSIISQVYQYVIGRGVLGGWMSVMGMFHLLKPSSIEF